MADISFAQRVADARRQGTPLVIDGAMGTMLQQKGFAGNFDLLVLTHPDAVADVHRQYLRAGADLIETDTFNAQALSLSGFGLTERVRDINLAAARLARSEADRMTALTPHKPRFVAGSVGPTGHTCSLSPDINDPARRDISFDPLCAAYTEQMEALIDGGVDALLIETIFDTLNAKAALHAARCAMSRCGRTVPVMLSVTIADAGGRLLAGQTLEAFVATVSPYEPFSIGLNCSFGADQMKPFLRRLRTVWQGPVTAYPNAGLPNAMGQYDQTPSAMAQAVVPFVAEGLADIVGGCCGTTPAHIHAIAEALEAIRTPSAAENSDAACCLLAGHETLKVENAFVNIGERCNVAGSRKFLRLIGEKQYDEALAIARRQVEDGAMVLDINMDDGLLDTRSEMVAFLNLMASDPEVARVPWMIDSSQFEVIEAALRCIQGKAIVNSLSLKEGEECFLQRAAIVRDFGAALVVMAFDEAGQATTYQRKIEVCERAYRLLTEQLHFPPQDIIFDPNILTVATGMPEHDRYALDFIEATRWIHAHLPGAKVSGGVSNLSFAFRGHNALREAMHATFLYHAIGAGLDMAIMNPSAKVMYQDIEPSLLEALENVILCRRPDAAERLMEKAKNADEIAENSGTETVPTRPQTVEERLAEDLQKGSDEHLAEDLDDALALYPSAAAIIEGPLMAGMTRVGTLFGEGKMFLPQVIRTARTMKAAIAHLQPHLTASAATTAADGPVYVLATVKGDVHDIGKNIAAVILACNGFRVVDLGVMVPPERIVEAVQQEHADFVCLSGLITPSLGEMCTVAQELQKAGIRIPLFISGATTSEQHTALRIAPLYDGPVIHLKDASQNPVIAKRLLSDEAGSYLAAHAKKQEELRKNALSTDGNSTTEASAQPSAAAAVCPPAHKGEVLYREVPVATLQPYINWIPFYHLWRVPADSDEGRRLRAEADALLHTFVREAYTLHTAVYLGAAHSATGSLVLTVHDDKMPSTANRTLVTPKNTVSIAVPQRLADYVGPKGSGDHVGLFAVTVCPALATLGHDDLLAQSLCDRLAEAGSEWLHQQVRTTLWGYVPDEQLTIDELFRGHYQGIRPAVGYSSLPDQSQIFRIDNILHLGTIGITLTENGAMNPPSSVCGLYIANPEARYF